MLHFGSNITFVSNVRTPDPLAKDRGLSVLGFSGRMDCPARVLRWWADSLLLLKWALLYAYARESRSVSVLDSLMSAMRNGNFP